MKICRVGASLSPDGIRWALVEGTERRLALRARGMIERGPGESDEDLIRRLREAAGPEVHRIRILDDASPPILRITALPKMPQKERAQALAMEAATETEILGEEVTHSSLDLPPAREGNRSLLAILPAARVAELRSLLAGQAFLLDGICVGPVVLLGLLRELGLLEPDRVTAVVEIGSLRVNLAVTRGAEIRMLRQVHEGLDGSFLTGTDGGTAAIDAVDRGLVDLVELVGQIRRTLTRPEASHDGRVERIWIAGQAAARACNLDRLLQNDLRVPVGNLDIRQWKGWTGDLDLEDREAAGFALTLGLAALPAQGLGMVFGSEKGRGGPRPLLMAAALAGVAANLLLGVLVPPAGETADRLRERVEALGAAVPAAPIVTQEEFDAWIAERLEPFAALPDPGALLDRVASRLPDEIRLVWADLRTDEESWTFILEGFAEDRDPLVRQERLDRFVGSLAADESFASVRLGPLSHGTGPVRPGQPLRFTLLLSNRPDLPEEIEP